MEKFRAIKYATFAVAVALTAYGPASQAAWTASFNDGVNNVSGTLSDLGFSAGAEHYALTLDTTLYSGAAGYVDSVDIKAFSNYSSFTFTASSGSWNDPAGTGGINNGPAGSTGCSGANGGFACIEAGAKGQSALQVGSIYTFTFAVVGATALNTTGIDAHVGVGYANASGLGPYGITSQLTSISAVPEPETYALILSGLGLMGAVTRRRRQAA